MSHGWWNRNSVGGGGGGAGGEKQVPEVGASMRGRGHVSQYNIYLILA